MNYKYVQLSLLGMLLMTVVPRPWATGFSAPETIAGAETLNAESLILLAQGVDDLQLIDARLNQDRTTGYIEGSISLSDLDTSCAKLETTVADKGQTLVFYSNGINCPRAARSIGKALECGYTRVYWLRGGFEEWRRGDFSYMLE